MIMAGTPLRTDPYGCLGLIQRLQTDKMAFIQQPLENECHVIAESEFTPTFQT